MKPPRRAAPLVCALLLAAPAPALAQSAGDEQYSDPLAEPAPPPSRSDSQPAGGSGSAPSAPAPPSSAAEPSTDATTTPAAAAPAEELPRTGFEAALLAWVGVGLLLAGTTIRRALPRTR